ncbi:MAG: hypothetical protein KTR31_07240 [Myxococcales bacterium]|nr:hypothetical protein [Myxococcales bacterium]
MSWIPEGEAHRRSPSCAFSDQCGGCDMDRATPAARHHALARWVARAFDTEILPPVVASPRSVGHRARIKLTIEDGRVGYRKARSHTLVDVEQCLAARPEIVEAHTRLRSWMATHRGTGLGSVELRSSGSRVVFAFTSVASVPRAVRDAFDELGDVALDGKRFAGDPTLVIDVLGHPLRCRARSFFQVNHEANALLVSHVRDAVRDSGVERVLDLYAGIGNLSVPIAHLPVPVVAVEVPGPASEDLRDNAAAAPDLRPMAMRVERLDPSRIAFDAVVLDPPRAGAGKVLERVIRNRPELVVYVSCHAPSAARDLRALQGYELTSLTCFDLFVDTSHIEAVAVLRRRSR